MVGAILSSAKAVLIGIDGGANCSSPTSSEQRKSGGRRGGETERKSVAIIQVTQAAMIKGDRSKREARHDAGKGKQVHPRYETCRIVFNFKQRKEKREGKETI